MAFELRILAPESVTNNSQQIVNKSTAALPEPAVIQAKSSIPEPKTDTLQQAQQQSMAQSQTPENTRHGTESPASTSEKPDPRSTKDGSPQRPTEAANISPRWSEIGAPQTTDVGPAHSSAELTKAPGDNSPLAIQETHIAAPEMPKATGPSEILLHLAGGDHASAAIRVAERAGTVNVSVHASDPVLRESLRSNLGDLSAQLGQQGWKAEVTKPAVFPTSSDNQQDSHARGQQSSHQRHAFGGDRQAPRERRNTKDWQQELDQQFSSGSALSGGKQ